MLKYLGIEAFRATPLVKEPFEHLIVERFIGPAALAEINADYPKISSSGSFPTDELTFGSAFSTLLDELNGDEFLEAISMRLNEIVRKPNGRFVISYVSGTPGAKAPPRVQ